MKSPFSRAIAEISPFLLLQRWVICPNSLSHNNCPSELNLNKLPELSATFDCSCFDGVYVTGGITEDYLNKIEQSRNDKAKKSASA